MIIMLNQQEGKLNLLFFFSLLIQRWEDRLELGFGAAKISLGHHHGSKKKKNHLKKCCAHSRWTLSTCHLERPWQTDTRGICWLSYSQTAMTSYPALAPRSGRERIKASVAFTGGETSKDYFAWWDNLVTTGVYVLLNCVCDIKNRIRERTRAVTPLAVSLFSSSVVSSTAADVRSAFEGRGRSWWTVAPCKSGCWLNDANVSCSTHFWSSFRRLLSCWALFVLQRTRALHRPTSFSHLSTYLDSHTSSDSLNPS